MNLYLDFFFWLSNFATFFSRHFKNWSIATVWASLVSQMAKNLPAMLETLGSIPGPGRSPGEANGKPLQYSCLENSHGQRSLVGYSPRGCKESDMTERQSTAQQLYNVICYGSISIFKGDTPFIVIMKQWLYSLCCTLYPCSLFYV